MKIAKEAGVVMIREGRGVLNRDGDTETLRKFRRLFARFPEKRINIFILKINAYTMNEIQYVYDASGNKKSVIIPVELWEQTLQAEKTHPAPCHPQDYFGIYRDIIKDPKGVSESLRNEWNRV